MGDTERRSRTWARIAAELAVSPDEPHWPAEIDDPLLGRYLTDTCTEAERRTIENELRNNPTVEAVVGVVRSAMEETIVRKGLERQGESACGIWSGQGPLRSLTGQLRAWTVETGQVIGAGFQDLLLRPQLALGQLLAEPGQARPVTWELPLDPRRARLRIGCEPSERNWRVTGQLIEVGEPHATTARFEIRRPDGPIEIASSWTEWNVEPLELPAGAWELRVFLDGDEWRILLEIGDTIAADS